jgi:8-oxo-dGTP pyrophosphatase MutT (NUDIX family)
VTRDLRHHELFADHDAIRAACQAGLTDHPPPLHERLDVPPTRGDHDLNPGTPPGVFGTTKRRAAVLVGLQPRDTGLDVLLTRRTAHLKSHAGQIAFPGGKVDDTDEGPGAAALREAQEEVGLPASAAEPLGYLDLYETGTGYRVVPLVAVIDPDFTPVPEPGEVEFVFHVPLGFVMDPANHARHHREFGGTRRYFYAIQFGEHYIWGATAGILRNLHDRVFASCFASS